MSRRSVDCIREVLQLAGQEARRFNHEYIGTEHLLLALIRGGCSGAVQVLRNHGIDLVKVRKEVEKIVQMGPDLVTMGGVPPTPRASGALERAREEAQSLDCGNDSGNVSSEHVLLGLLRDRDSVATQVLLNFGLEPAEGRKELLKSLSQRPDPRWRTSNVTALAQAIYDDRAFDRLPILADALEDAGCTDADILNHCRQPGEHVRGCWVVDLVLGKE